MSFVKKTKEKSKGEIQENSNITLCLPIRISDVNYKIGISNQKAVFELSNVKDLIHALESAFKTVDSIIKGTALATFEKTILSNLNGKGFDIKPGSTCIYKLLNSVDIYFVTHDLCGCKTDDGRVIPSDIVRTIALDKKELHNNIENEEFDKANERREDIEAVCLGTYRRDEKRYFAGEGFTPDKGCSIHSFEDVSKHCSIFLWIDHIYETSNKYYNISFEAPLTFVLLHELMHLMMDVFDETKFGIKSEENLKCLGQLYGYFREESLANALALHLCDSTGNEDLVYSILDHFVQNQTIPYQTGCLYIEKDILEMAVTNWMKCKTGKYLTKQLAKEWLLEITEEKPDSNNLRRIENELEKILLLNS